MSSRKAKGEADKNAVALREIQSSCPENKKCFECDQRGPTYVNMTIGAFVCTKCSGVLRGINPPHRIKSISMSSFTTDEVEFIRAKGNVYCAKVWLGLYDKGHGYNVDLKDEDAIKDFIIQKYEKRRYYVDPSTIRHSLGSTASTVSASSQQSSDLGSSSAATRPSGMIGTTIQLPNHKNRQATGSTISAIHRAAGSVSSPKTVKAKSNSSNAAVLAVLAAPDPFAPKKSSSAANNGGFGANFASLNLPEERQSLAKDNFANFEAAVFDSAPVPADPVPVPSRNATTSVLRPMNPSNSASKPAAESAPTPDRYAALKDLDEIFKSTVVMNDSPNLKPSGTTGASLFGSSQSATPPIQQNILSDVSSSPVAFGGGQQSAGNWVASWPATSNGSTGETKSSSNMPVNPFTGASNLTRLNTSPWPTTGTSPVQTVASPWPNNDDGFNGFSSSKSSTSSNPGHSQQGYPDPFGSAPSFNQQQSDSTDLFAKAPKPNFANDVTSPIFSGSTDLYNNAFMSASKKNGSKVGTDPWAGMLGSPQSGQQKENIFTASMMPSSNPNNPFL